MTESDLSPFIPLREPTFFILLSLVGSEKHGYSILKSVESLSGGRLRMSTGTLYEALARLLDQGLIERQETPEVTHPGKPRKVYRLTITGQRVIEAEANRLNALAAAARRQMGAEWTGSSFND